jgi:hypothetical protein
LEEFGDKVLRRFGERRFFEALDQLAQSLPSLT